MLIYSEKFGIWYMGLFPGLEIEKTNFDGLVNFKRDEKSNIYLHLRIM